MDTEKRPDPNELLNEINGSEQEAKRGKLKIYLGMCAGVGKTFTMLQDISQANGRGKNILIGYVETHGRAETEFLLFYLPQLERKKIEYKGIQHEELDIDEIIKRKPDIVVIDELAHTNAPGSRHKKRYQDVIEILNNGISVYTAMNIQHLESQAEIISQITGVPVRETVPDTILDMADELEVVDISPDELLSRLAEGKVYTKDKTEQAINNFFRRGNLIALREMLLRISADRIDKMMRDYMIKKRIEGPWKSGQRILIAISPSPASASLVRWARKVAYTMDASLLAVYIETPEPISENDKKILHQNLNLARELDAEVIISSGEDIVGSIIDIAKRENVTNILIGKPEKITFHKKFFKKDIISRIVKESGNIDVFIVNPKEEKTFTKKPKTIFLPSLHSNFSEYLLVAGIILVASFLCKLWAGFLGYQTVALILLLIVSLLPLKFGRGPILLAAIMCPIIWDYFFVPPFYTIYISKKEDFLLFLSFIIFAMVSGTLISRLRASREIIKNREQITLSLLRFANSLSNATGIAGIIKSSKENIAKFLSAESIFYLADDFGKLTTDIEQVSEKEKAIIYWVYQNSQRAGKFTETLNQTEYIYFPIKGKRSTYGVAGIKFDNDFIYTTQTESLLDNFMLQIGTATEREFLNNTAKKIKVLEESENLYKNIFNSISHELKTPLAAIISALDILKSHVEDDNIQLRKSLYKEIRISVHRLNKFIEDLLDMARLESGRVKLNPGWCDIKDIIAEVIKNIQSGGIKYKIIGNEIEFKFEGKEKILKQKFSDDFPLINVDFILFQTALKNIIHNAIIHTPDKTEIEITGDFDENNIYISISDNGNGIPEKDLDKLFDKFHRASSNRGEGTGLGLSIAKGFIEIHSGTITVKNKKTGGASFLITIPRKLEKVL